MKLLLAICWVLALSTPLQAMHSFARARTPQTRAPKQNNFRFSTLEDQQRRVRQLIFTQKNQIDIAHIRVQFASNVRNGAYNRKLNCFNSSGYADTACLRRDSCKCYAYLESCSAMFRRELNDLGMHQDCLKGLLSQAKNIRSNIRINNLRKKTITKIV